jgi:hypothetical protein
MDNCLCICVTRIGIHTCTKRTCSISSLCTTRRFHRTSKQLFERSSSTPTTTATRR